MTDSTERTSRWTGDARPRLASKVRLQWNAARGQALLLYPEGALVLNPTGHAVLELCDGQRTLSGIVQELASRFDGSAGTGTSASAATSVEPVSLSTDPGTSDVPDPSPAEQPETSDVPDPTRAKEGGPAAASPPASAAERALVVERDVKAFLERLDQRGWVVDEASGGDR